MRRECLAQLVKRIVTIALPPARESEGSIRLEKPGYPPWLAASLCTMLRV